MTQEFAPIERPTQLLRDLLLTYWNTQSGVVPIPQILEKPNDDAMRVDLRNVGDAVWIYQRGFQERHITIGFQHREITVDMGLTVANCTSRQRMYDIVGEIRRIIFSKQHEPDDYLLDGFESYSTTPILVGTWLDTTGFSTITLNTSVSKFGSKSMRIVTAGGDGEAYRALPATTVLVPRPYPGRLRQVRLYAKTDSGSPVLGVTLRDASNRAGLFRTWNITVSNTDFTSYTADLTSTADASAGVWDNSLIDEIAITSIDSGRTIDIDHIDLATDEFQFLSYYGYTENVETFNYWESEIHCSYRSHGDIVPVLT
jgi:hypothetical protein